MREGKGTQEGVELFHAEVDGETRKNREEMKTLADWPMSLTLASKEVWHYVESFRVLCEGGRDSIEQWRAEPWATQGRHCRGAVLRSEPSSVPFSKYQRLFLDEFWEAVFFFFALFIFYILLQV